jgi:putative transposase
MPSRQRAVSVGAVPRPPRNWVPGGTYHIFSRGSNRHALFLGDADRLDFLEYTEVVVRRYRLTCLVFVLMTNHVHLMLRTPFTPDPALSTALRDLNGTHARRFNRRHGREAHTFRNRFGAVYQETTEQLIWTVRYILRNPIEAGLCMHPSDWPWSSFNATAGLATPPPFLSVGALLDHFGATPESARPRFVELVESETLPDRDLRTAA